MATAVITYTDEDTGTVFRWHGGAYIDVGSIYQVPSYRLAQYEPGIDGDDFHAYDVISVWDYSATEERSTLEAPEWTVNTDNDGEWAYLGHLDNASRPFVAVLERFEATCRRYILAAQQEDED